MAYVVVEICCAPNGEHKYAVPTTLRIARIFADATEAAKEFAQDTYYKAESEYAGQDIYYVLWKLDEPLNLDRCIIQDNSISNCGMWLPDSERLYADVGDLEVELMPPERIKQRAKAKAQAEKAALAAAQKSRRGNVKIARGGDDDGNENIGGGGGDGEYHSSSSSSSHNPNARYARGIAAGTPWKKFA